jgi:hypothetical protein
MTKLEIGGKERTLRFKLSTGVRFEDATGMTLTEALPKMGVGTLAVLLWLGLSKEDEKVTRSKVLDWMDEYVEQGGDVTDLWEAINDRLLLDGLFGKEAADKAKGKAAGSIVTE